MPAHVHRRPLREAVHVVLALAIFGALPAAAQSVVAAVSDVATVDVLSGVVRFLPRVDAEAFLLRVTGPEDYVFEQVVRDGAPHFELQPDMIDGAYSWELVPTPRIGGATRIALERARRTGEMDEVDALRRRGVLSPRRAQGGTVTVADGAFVIPVEEKAAEAGTGPAIPNKAQDLAAGTPTKDLVINDDLIVFGSACIGITCFNGESFGTDTLRLKETTLRLHFQDTSLSPYPTNDWRLVANDTTSGGGNRFSIEDVDGGRTPFTVEAGARSSALYVDDTGRVGFGTSTPLEALHVVTGDSPTLRLEQDTSGGFAAQTWDLAGNESSFFIRDTTGGSTYPFRIQPGAGTNTLVLDADGQVGIGTMTPSAKLEVNVSASGTIQLGENLGGATGDDPQIRMINTGAAPDNTWSFTTQDASFAIDDEDSVGVEFQLNDSGRVRFRAANVTTFDLATSGNLTITGTLTENSDINAKTDFSVVDPSDVLARLAAMPISTWAYRDAPGARHIGPMAQDFYNAFGLGGTATGLAPRNLASVALAAVQGLDAETAAEVAALRAENARLQERLAALEALVAGLAGGVE